MLRWHSSGNEVRLCLRCCGGPVEKEDAEFAVHVGVCARDSWEKRKVVIVSVLLPVAIDLALRSKTPRRIYVLRVCQVPTLHGVATGAKAFT